MEGSTRGGPLLAGPVVLHRVVVLVPVVPAADQAIVLVAEVVTQGLAAVLDQAVHLHEVE